MIITLTEKKKSQKLLIDKEKPYLKINNVINNSPSSINKNVRVKYKFGLFSSGDYEPNELSFNTEIVLLNTKNINYDYIIFECDVIDPETDKFRIVIDYSIRYNFIINDYYTDFDTYFSESSNVKSLFSGKFGHGKSTFLKNYFEDRSEIYHPIILYPVNYSITSNEDIFKYIKCEILFQLLKVEGLEFNKQEFSIFYTIPEFFKKNVHNVLAPFINIIPGIGGDLYTVYEKLFELGKNLFDFHKNSKIDDKNNAENFISQFFEKEGSLFENNFYTQLIRYLLSQIQGKGKKVVLVIEDTDRIDPEHIFRIFNVFAAHFDSYERENECLSNKFGFDKIIIVCDIDNIQCIFKHRYGSDTDFNGYINKFFSKSPYKLNSKQVISQIINQIYSRNVNVKDMHIEFLKIILNDLNESSCITLREVLKIKNAVIPSTSIEENEKFLYHTFYCHVKLLSTIINPISLKDRFEICSNYFESHLNNDHDYFGMSNNALLALSFKPYIIDPSGENIISTYNKEDYHFNILSRNVNNYQLFDAKLDPKQHSYPPSFGKVHFYRILSEVTSRYIYELNN